MLQLAFLHYQLSLYKTTTYIKHFNILYSYILIYLDTGNTSTSKTIRYNRNTNEIAGNNIRKFENFRDIDLSYLKYFQFL